MLWPPVLPGLGSALPTGDPTSWVDARRSARERAPAARVGQSGTVELPGVDVPQVLEDLSRAVADEQGHDLALLSGYLPALLSVAGAQRRFSELERDTCQQLGGEAAQAGMGLPALVDLYMTASRRLWPRLPELVAAQRGRPVRPAELIALGEAVWHAADDALAALAAGYLQAQRLVVRREESARLQFLDGLLSGSADVGALVERAEPYGLNLAAAHLVAVARVGQPAEADARVTDWVEQAVRARFGGRGVLVAVKDGRLVCVLSAGPDGSGHDQQQAARQFADVTAAAAAELAAGSSMRVGVSRAFAGPLGVFRGYREALEALDVADRLGLPESVVHARQLLVYRVLLRDETAMSELVEEVLGPLLTARDGPDRLLHTLDTYFAAGGNAAAAARALHLSVRALTYRLHRVAELTGYAAGDPAHQLPLQVAVTGARLLGWPHRPPSRG